MNWRPIEDAPRDGTKFLAAGHSWGDPAKGRFVAAFYYSDGELWDDILEGPSGGHYLTHFVLLSDLELPE